MVGSPPANVGDVGLGPGPGGLHMAGPCAMAAEPALWSLRAATT